MSYEIEQVDELDVDLYVSEIEYDPTEDTNKINISLRVTYSPLSASSIRKFTVEIGKSKKEIARMEKLIEKQSKKVRKKLGEIKAELKSLETLGKSGTLSLHKLANILLQVAEEGVHPKEES